MEGTCICTHGRATRNRHLSPKRKSQRDGGEERERETLCSVNCDKCQDEREMLFCFQITDCSM